MLFVKAAGVALILLSRTLLAAGKSGWQNVLLVKYARSFLEINKNAGMVSKILSIFDSDNRVILLSNG